MYEGEMAWAAVDQYCIERLVLEDDALLGARLSSADAVLPHSEVTPNQGAFLAIIAQITGAKRVLEFGTLAGYSTIWLARAVGPEGRVMTLEIDEPTAAIAKANFVHAGVSDRIEVILGLAADSVQDLIEAKTDPFDLVFIDADKPNNSRYLEAALALSRPGTVIICDNVVRGGEILLPESDDPRVHGSRAVIDLFGRDPRIDATVLQTVGLKGWDGFAIGVVRDL